MWLGVCGWGCVVGGVWLGVVVGVGGVGGVVVGVGGVVVGVVVAVGVGGVWLGVCGWGL